MNKLLKCRLINMACLGENAVGFLSVAESMRDIPFVIQRVYWTYQTPSDIIRGQHAHIQLQQVIIAVAGTIKIKCEYLDGTIEEFILEHPSQGLYVPIMVWRHISFSKGAVMLCLASELYDVKDYIRDYKVFENSKYLYK